MLNRNLKAILRFKKSLDHGLFRRTISFAENPHHTWSGPERNILLLLDMIFSVPITNVGHFESIPGINTSSSNDVAGTLFDLV